MVCKLLVMDMLFLYKSYSHLEFLLKELKAYPIYTRNAFKPLAPVLTVPLYSK